ncbi:MAG TPA: amino acid adenylation domain-containing protein, partial [Terriglobia bacterium]|nr:amino acid adenylation domain-containing protein [Terriglobia bacterium]
QLMARVEKILGSVSLSTLFQSPTIEGIAENLQKQRSKHASLKPLAVQGSNQPKVPDIQHKRKAAQPAPLSFSQQRLWFIDRFLPGRSLYNIPIAFRLRGSLDIPCLQRSLEAVVQRHEVLRTTIGDVDGEPFQVVTQDWSLELAVRDLTTRPESLRDDEASNLVSEEALRPFDLGRDLMLRATLLKLAEGNHILLLVMHHIVSDGWSLSILMRELSHYYQRYRVGKEGNLEELPIQYADYAVWQRKWLQGETLEKQLSYWRQNLAGAPGALELPTDRPRPAIQTFHGAYERTQLPPRLVQNLKVFCSREKVTLFMTLLAAFQVLLSRYADRDDIVVGSPIAGRGRQETEDLIGFFVNTLVLRTDLSGDPTFRELLGRVREVALGAYAHQDVPFERLVDELQAERDLSHHSLVQVMFVLQNAPQGKMALSGLDISPFRIRGNQAKFDLTLSVAEVESGMTVALGFSTDLFETFTIQQMLAHFRLLLESVVEHPERRLSRVDFLTEEERIQFKQWNETEREYPRERCLAELFEEQARGRAEAVALVCEERELTYGELNRRANQLGHYLKQRGVGPEVRVGICLNRSVEMVVGLLGILKAGGTYVPLDRAYPGERLNYMIQDAGIRMLLTQQQGLESSTIGDGLEAICLDRDWHLVSRESEANLRQCGTAETLAYLMYTSGSTGQPKGVGIPHRAVSRLVLETNYARFGKEEVFLQMAPTSFDASTFELWGALLHGSRCVLYPEGLPNLKTLGDLIRHHQVTTLWLTASLFNTVIDDAPEILRPVRQLLIGGEALSVTHVRRAKEQLPDTQIINGYGPTENTTFTCCHPIPKELDESRSIPIGTPIANTQVYLLDRYLNPVPVGVVGELYAGGEGLARGYWFRPDLTAERFVPNPFGQTEGERLYQSGDLARYLPDGSIEFIGRTDHQVKIRGFRIELGEIESVLSQHPAVREAVVVAREDTPGKQSLVAYVVGLGDSSCDAGELRSFLRNKLPDYMVPSAYVFLEALPLTPNGKLNRRALPAVSGERKHSEDYLGPRNELETSLVGIWEELLKTRPIGVRDNFFELGGHSLLA